MNESTPGAETPGGVPAETGRIDISVSMTLLTEIQGKLARLQPVHYELVRQR